MIKKILRVNTYIPLRESRLMKCFLQEESAICKLENGLDWRKGIHLKNFYYVIKFLETIEIKSLLHFLTLP